METILYLVHIVVCLAMLPIILLQSGKGGGVSAAFGGGGSGSVLGGSRGASSFLTKMTSGAAIIFMLTSLGLAYTSSQSKSVVGDLPLEQSTKTPALDEQPAGGALPVTSTPAAP
ncbi:MAG: preprotein translocase subunit SecG [Deltaproteobacteria bacterium]|nr:preprotein translocase subunit SecG [Deltaproteobacteria bacterium]